MGLQILVFLFFKCLKCLYLPANFIISTVRCSIDGPIQITIPSHPIPYNQPLIGLHVLKHSIVRFVISSQSVRHQLVIQTRPDQKKRKKRKKEKKEKKEKERKR